MKRKLFVILTMLFLSMTLFASKNSTVIRTFEKKFPQDKFYFIQGLDYKFDLNTSIRYRGILYSDRLEKMGYPFGLELALEGGSDGLEYLENYESLFLKIQVDKPIEDKMKEIFGPKSVLENNFYPYIDGYREMLEIKGKKVPFEEKGRADYTVVNLFVDKLEDINKEEMKRKAYQFAKFLQDDINLRTYLQIYIRDNSFFENYNLAAYQVYPPFRNRKDIKIILNKIKNKEKISEKEKITLVNVFHKDFPFKKIAFIPIRMMFDKKELKDYPNQKIYMDEITIRN